ncbi:MAG: metallophosphoesterase [Bifidobacterium sp.]|jgi:hypothetical protein|nr:metallophosphoesterase [Bifidobacterium sp.]MCH4175390.1 metallophosphoesterase [Bifidobacterium sp.]
MKTKLGRFMSRMAAVLLATSMSVAVGLVSTQAQAATASGASITGAMPVVITELAVKTSNGSYTGSDGSSVSVNIGEYIELSNVSSKAVNISDLSLQYNNVDWTPEAFDNAAQDSTKDAQIPAHGTVILWDNYAFANMEGISPRLTTAEDFGNFWQSKAQNMPQLTMGTNLFTISKGAGMANSSARSLVLTQKSTQATNTVSYASSGATDTTLNYTYDAQGVGTLSSGNVASPGSVLSGQLPESWPQAESRTVTVTDASISQDNLRDDQAINVKAKVSSSDGLTNIASVRLFTKTNVDTDFSDSTFDGMQDGDVWSFTIPAGTLTGKTSVDYEFVATDLDGVRTIGTGASITLTPQEQNTYGKATVPLAITEIMPDTKNVGGSDGFEFIEVTNISEKQIDFSNNYTLYYSYPDQGDSGDVEWPAQQSNIIIPAGKSVVFWIKNGPNDTLTDADFNQAFGLSGDQSLTMGANLFEIKSAGMANNSARAIKIQTKTKTLVSSASYPVNASKNLTGDTHSLQYVYSAGENETKIVRSDQAPTPGSVQSDDIRATSYAFPSATKVPSVVDTTPTSFSSDQDVKYSFEVTSSLAINRVTLYTRHKGESDVVAHNLTKTAGSDVYSYTENKIDLVKVQAIEYYLEVSDGINPVQNSGQKTITGSDYTDSAVRLNVKDGQFLRGKVTLRGTGTDSNDMPALAVDGTAVESSQTTDSLESEPYIAAEITQTDIFFFNSFTTKTTITGTPTEDDWKDNVIGSFDDGTYGDTQTVSFPVPLEQIHDNTLSLYLNAGTKSSATDILDAAGTVNSENADNYLASNIRLVLPDGTHVKASKAVAAVSPGTEGTISEKDVTDEVGNATNQLKIGDSAGQYEYIRLDFTIDSKSVTSKQYVWNTAQQSDGEHTVTAQSQSGSATSKVIVDNTKPTIEPELTAQGGDGNVLRGSVVINATAKDATSGIPATGESGALSATLSDGDGEATSITLPYDTSSAKLSAGLHTVTFNVTDNAGNQTTKKVTFTTYAENPSILSLDSTAGTKKLDPTLSVTAKGNSGDKLNVAFYAGEEYKPSNQQQVSVTTGTTKQSGLAQDASSESLAESDAAKLDAAGDGKVIETTATDSGFPYQSFTVTVPSQYEQDANAATTLRWSGSAQAGADIYAFVKNTSTGAWDQVSRVSADSEGNASISQRVANTDHVADGKMSVVVQNGAGFAAGNLSENDTEDTNPDGLQSPVSDSTSTINGADGNPVVTMNDDAISQDDTARSDYDFTFAWESDTQYYNANYDNDGYYQHQSNIHDWLLKTKNAMNIQYLFHTGDIVDNAEIPEQWERADEQYKKLDDAKFPYGVLAGNHDVDHKSEDYVNYSKHFGASRYSSNPWYGGSFEDNRGHYDLISAGGIDFIVVSVGWGVEDDEINWMNQVLAQYPDRVAILNFHEYLLASGGLGLIPQDIYKRVVVPNDNVKMVFSGHYHSAQKTVSRIDSDGDGKTDRNVLNLLFDYQAMDEGGMGFLRLMHVNTKNATMEVRTYSPSIQKYGSQTVASSSFKPSDEQFTVDLTELGIQPQTAETSQKRLSTDAFAADLQSSALIGTTEAISAKGSAAQQRSGLVRGLSSENKTLVEDAEDAATATVTWKDALAGTHGWYAVVTNQFGGSTTTRVSYVSATGKSSSSDNDGSGQDNGSNGDNDGGGSNGQSGAGSDTGHSGGTTQHGSDSDGDSAAKGNATDSDSKSLATQKTNILQERLAKTGTNSLLIVAAIVLLALCGVGLRWFKAVNK